MNDKKKLYLCLKRVKALNYYIFSPQTSTGTLQCSSVWRN